MVRITNLFCVCLCYILFIGFILPECNNYFSSIGLADENESVRDAALGAGHVLVEHYAATYVNMCFLCYRYMLNHCFL